MMSESNSAQEPEKRIQKVSDSRDRFEDLTAAVGQYSRRKDAREYYAPRNTVRYCLKVRKRTSNKCGGYHPHSRRLFNQWKSAWTRGEVLPKDGIFELIQEYCWEIYCTLPPEKALAELVAIRKQYGDEKGPFFGGYRISKMIAGCHASSEIMKKQREN